MTILMLAGCAGAGSPADSGAQDQLSPSAPAIIAVEGAGSDSLRVRISDSAQAGYSLQVAVPDGMSTDTRKLSLVSGMGSPVELHFRSSDIFAVVSGEAVISITRDAQVLESRRVMVQTPALQLEDDTLYAIPLQTEAGVGEAAEGLKTELRTQITSAGLGPRLARTWRSETSRAMTALKRVMSFVARLIPICLSVRSISSYRNTMP